MRFEDQPASGADPGSAEPPSRPVRRTPRSWSVPAGGDRLDRAGSEDWVREPLAPPTPPAPRRRLGGVPPAPLPPPPPASFGTDLGPLTALLGELRSELGQLRTALEASATAGDGSLVTGVELAASIEALGTTLGSGIAALLTEHRSLLARDVEGAAVKILEEVNQRLRASGTLVVDGVEERVRHVNAKSLGDVVEQLDLRLDQLQADVTGLRAVMLEIPDQTAVVERLDQLAQTGGRKETSRLTPAMSAAIERSVATGLSRLQDDLEGRLAGAGGGGEGLDPATIEAFTTEMTALRRRISLRTDARGEAIELSERQLDDLAERIVARMGGSAEPAAKAGKASKAAVPAISLDDEDTDDDDGDEPDPDVPVPRRSRRSTGATAKRATKRS